jgi:hypothetical protein
MRSGIHSIIVATDGWFHPWVRRAVSCLVLSPLGHVGAGEDLNDNTSVHTKV